ncbi:MAG: hypothetical protein LBT00_04945 [Spirochaetaceae bacterium]|nr:hypothetical protein [Spirochaetaceae bacterium]
MGTVVCRKPASPPPNGTPFGEGLFFLSGPTGEGSSSLRGRGKPQLATATRVVCWIASLLSASQ